jgi:hypothetical protein
MYVSHSAPHGKLDVLDHGRVPFTASLRVVRRAEGLQALKVSKPANTGGGDNDGVGGHGAAGGHRHASTGYTSTVTTYTGSLTTTTRHAGGSSGGRRCRSASVALSCGTPETVSRATTSTSADKGGHGDALPEPRWLLQTHRGIQGRGGGPVKRESHGNLGNTITQFGADLAGVYTK